MKRRTTKQAIAVDAPAMPADVTLPPLEGMPAKKADRSMLKGMMRGEGRFDSKIQITLTPSQLAFTDYVAHKCGLSRNAFIRAAMRGLANVLASLPNHELMRLREYMNDDEADNWFAMRAAHEAHSEYCSGERGTASAHPEPGYKGEILLDDDPHT